jgi:hypothetical protein
LHLDLGLGFYWSVLLICILLMAEQLCVYIRVSGVVCVAVTLGKSSPAMGLPRHTMLRDKNYQEIKLLVAGIGPSQVWALPLGVAGRMQWTIFTVLCQAQP